MKYINKIKQLFNKSEISFEQGRLMFEAFKESQEHEKAVYEQIDLQKHKREKSIWGILAIWMFLLTFCLGLLMFYGNSDKLGQKTLKAFKEADLAAIYLAKGDYDQASDLYLSSIEIDPEFSLGYSLLAITNEILYHEKGNKEYLERHNKALDGLRSLVVNKKIETVPDNKGSLFLVIFVVLAVSVFKIVSMLIYSILIKKEERVNKAWAQASVYYLRRLDLIPPLLEAVKEYSTHEREALKTVLIAASQAKEKLRNAGGIAPQNSEMLEETVGDDTSLERSLKDIYVFIERFPKLKAEKKYDVIQREIDDTEKSLYKAIERYNTRARVYNSTLRSLPYNLIAGKFGFQNKSNINIKN